MELEDVKSNWDALGRENPLWAILSSHDEWNVGAFFETGRREIQEMLVQLEEFDLRPTGRALDFGCGAGRLTQALAEHFDSVVGVDVARSMISLAKEYNQRGDKCRFVLNEAADLSCFDDASFEFLYTNIVLQHVGTELAKGYLNEFFRIVAPGGIMVFQVPSHLVPVKVISPEGCKACIKVIYPETRGEEALRAPAGTPIPFSLRVQNTGTESWGAEEQVRVGFQWFRDGGGSSVLIDDGQRVYLPRRLAPGDSVEIPFLLDLPATSGVYVLEVDMVQETVAWFKEHGSEVTRLAVVTTAPAGVGAESDTRDVAASDDRASESAPVIARMEMHPVSREDVGEIVNRNGGVIVAALDDVAAGPEWVSFRYIVRCPRMEDVQA